MAKLWNIKWIIVQVHKFFQHCKKEYVSKSAKMCYNKKKNVYNNFVFFTEDSKKRSSIFKILKKIFIFEISRKSYKSKFISCPSFLEEFSRRFYSAVSPQWRDRGVQFESCVRRERNYESLSFFLMKICNGYNSDCSGWSDCI